MMLSEVSVKRPVFAAVISMLLVIVGIVAFVHLPIREHPDIAENMISVETTYPGAAATVVESRITQVLEERISGIEGLDVIRSSTSDGFSDLTLEFATSRDIDSAANDVRDRIGDVLDDLPDEATAPEIRKIDADAQPILWLQLSGAGWSPAQLTDYADRTIIDRLSSIDGVARVVIGGAARPAMRIWLDRKKLAAFNLTSGDVEDALRKQNVEHPAGRVESPGGLNLTIRLSRGFSTPEEFRDLVVGRGANAYLVRLGDVARVESGRENIYSDFRGNGQPAVGLGIIRQSGANTLEVANAVKDMAAKLAQTLPAGTNLDVSGDTSLFIDKAIDNVYATLIEAALLVILVIYAFLGSARATFIPAITVPICIVATFAVLWAFGFSINLLTLLALVLSIGLVVDDAIVVLENIHHRIARGESPLIASFDGARQVAFAVLATTLVVCAVFVPVMFISGPVGMLFRELAVAMIGAVAFSGFLALSLTPMLCSKMLRSDTRQNRFTRWFDERFQRFAGSYQRLLRRVINRPVLIGAMAAAIVAACALLGGTLKSELAPEEDKGYFTVNVRAAEGTSYDRMHGYMRELEQSLMPMVKDGPIRRLMVSTPAGYTASEEFNTGAMTVYLVPWDERTLSTRDVAKLVQARLADHPAVSAAVSVSSSILPAYGRPIRFVMTGSSFEDLTKARDAVLAAAADYPGIADLQADYEETNPQLVIDVDTVRAGDLGVSFTEVGSTLETMLGSRRVTTYVDRGEEYRVIVQAGLEDRLDLDDLNNVHVRSDRNGELIPLSNLVRVRTHAGAAELTHFNKMRAITLQGNPAAGYTLGEALDFLQKEAAKHPEVAQVGYMGESKTFMETGSSIYVVLAITLLIIYLLLAAQFESFVHPTVIILTAPLALGGALLGLLVMGVTLNIYSQIGIVMLVGLAAKNGILIVEFANQLREDGRGITDAAIEASTRRLRPVLMTSIATVAGAIPLMAASGPGAAARQAIGVVIVSGVSVATVLTLFVIPVFYNRFSRWTGSANAVARRLEIERHAAAAQPAE
jgi:multidrug efflux pump